MTSFDHISVLLHETVHLLCSGLSQKFDSGRAIFADCTLGGAGHTLLLLKTLSAAIEKQHGSHLEFEVLCCDQDAFALAIAQERINDWLRTNPAAAKQINVNLLAINFRDFPHWFANNRKEFKLNGLMADLGVSSPQLDSAERGFSFLREGPLDMRMNNSQGRTAKELLEQLDEKELTRIFQEFGEEPRARALARAIVKDRASGLLPMSNTVEFAQYVARVLGYHQSRVHPATRVFQALRIAVNEELSAVEDLLSAIPELMAEDGWAAVISFHSLEDRLVKRYFRAWEAGALTPQAKQASEKKQWMEAQMGLSAVAGDNRLSLGEESPRGGVVAQADELQRNPRSRSARLRGFHFLKST
ncbi:16S rRNA (cytosine(1402)-N(4))-methyltransferase RsmH [bacterium]|nr:16S rRNA (cytosine(1402)-N(4))-methyltransferase RsmH [bacterium]